MGFKEITAEAFEKDARVFTMIDKEWMAVTTTDGKKATAMTASWGGLGIMWHKHVLTAYIRKSRYTEPLLEKNGRFSAAFFGTGFRKELGVLGTVSGRDTDKLADVGFTTVELDGVPAIEQADIGLICKNLYRQEMKKELLTEAGYAEEFYADDDMHVLYIAEIEKIYIKE